MGWATYQVPTPFLVEHAFLTRLDLGSVGEDERPAWDAAGVDPEAEAATVGALLADLRAARKDGRRADVRLRWTRTRSKAVAVAAHAWLDWLATTADEARRHVASPTVLLDVADLRRHAPTVKRTLARLRQVVPDVARERTARPRRPGAGAPRRRGGPPRGARRGLGRGARGGRGAEGDHRA